jgi:hypothetical protein
MINQIDKLNRYANNKKLYTTKVYHRMTEFGYNSDTTLRPELNNVDFRTVLMENTTDLDYIRYTPDMELWRGTRARTANLIQFYDERRRLDE